MFEAKRYVSIFIVLLCVGYSVVAGAQTNASKGPMTSASAAQGNINAQSVEVAVLKAQLESTLRFQEQILNTVWWALGALATTAALLVGYNWFTNYRGIERERVALRRELANDIKNLETLLLGKIDQKQKDAEKQLEEIAEDRVKRMEGKLQGQLNNHATAINELKRKTRESERQSWLSQGAFRNALQCSIDILELASEDGFHLYISDALGKVSNDVSALEKKSKEATDFALDTYLAQNVVTVLDKVDGTAAAIANEIKQRLLKIRTKA